MLVVFRTCNIWREGQRERKRESELINETESSTIMLLPELVTLFILKLASFQPPLDEPGLAGT